MKQYRLSSSQKTELIDKFTTGKYSFNNLSKEYNISLQAIKGLLNRRGLVAIPQTELQRKYPINETFFDKIETQEKAYFLGILYADGYNNTDRNTVALSLKEDDKTILERLNNLLQPTKPLQYIHVKGENKNNQYRLVIANKHISKRLADIGLTKAKTFSITFPEWIDKKLIHHFIRGYFDGDGWVGDMAISIVGTDLFCQSVARLIKEELGISSYMRTRHPERANNIRMLECGGRNQVAKFGEYIYKEATLFLERKKSRFDKVKNYIPKTIKAKTNCEFCGKEENKITKGCCRKCYYKNYGIEKRKNRYIILHK